jgi:hypothetical protein
MKSKKSKKPLYYTARETALLIGAMMHRRKLKLARVPRDLLLDIASNPGGARRDRLFTSFVRDVQKHLVETGRYSALMTSQDLLVMSGDEAHERVPVLAKKDLTPAEWKGKINWDDLEAEAEWGP